MPGRSSRSKANADLLMTFGNPLRPVHDSRFPILYAWTFRHGPPDKEGPLAKVCAVVILGFLVQWQLMAQALKIIGLIDPRPASAAQDCLVNYTPSRDEGPFSLRLCAQRRRHVGWQLGDAVEK
jgi:hypothetical protein